MMWATLLINKIQWLSHMGFHTGAITLLYISPQAEAIKFATFMRFYRFAGGIGSSKRNFTGTSLI